MKSANLEAKRFAFVEVSLKRVFRINNFWVVAQFAQSLTEMGIIKIESFWAVQTSDFWSGGSVEKVSQIDNWTSSTTHLEVDDAQFQFSIVVPAKPLILDLITLSLAIIFSLVNIFIAYQLIGYYLI